MDESGEGPESGKKRNSLEAALPAAGGLVFLGATIALVAVVRPPGFGTVPYLLAGAALLGLILGVVSFARNLRGQRDEAARRASDSNFQNRDLEHRVVGLQQAARESETVLNAMRAHIMLVDSSYLIVRRYSSELEDVFHQSKAANENLLNVLQRLLSDRMFKTARDYLTLLFDESKRERTVLKVNPLDEVEVNVLGPDGAPAVRYLTFSFRRIIEDGSIARIFVSAEDVTERVIRERQLRESEQQKVKQFEMLIGVMAVEPRALHDFIETTESELQAVDEALRAQDFASATLGQTALLRQRLEVVLRCVHNIKGNATMLRLQHFERAAGAFEAKIIDLRNRPALGGDDFLQIVILSSELRNDVEELQSLRTKLAGMHKIGGAGRDGGDDLIASIASLASSLATKAGREVTLDAAGFDTRVLRADQRLVVKDVLIQLTRNSLAHGIEPPSEREAAGKARTATISIRRTSDAGDAFGFTYRDDGCGLDPAKIRTRAVELGLVSAADAAAVDDSEIAGFIFTPSFSTAATAGEDAGRGVGMNVIKKRVIDECGGEISVNSEVGKFCEFSFLLPVRASEAARR